MYVWGVEGNDISLSYGFIADVFCLLRAQAALRARFTKSMKDACRLSVCASILL